MKNASVQFQSVVDRVTCIRITHYAILLIIGWGVRPVHWAACLHSRSRLGRHFCQKSGSTIARWRRSKRSAELDQLCVEGIDSFSDPSLLSMALSSASIPSRNS
jgi:hypothetical protein